MRACPAAPRRLLLFLLLLLLLLGPQGGRPEASPPARRPGPEAPGGRPPPAAPERVRFVARTFQHVLLWAPPAAERAPGLLYDVQVKRYGNPSWTPVGRCAALARPACDLTAHTARPRQRYFARVRARRHPRGAPSRWAHAGPFSPEEATLQLWNVSLSLSGNILRVTLELPAHRGEHTTVTYQDLHPGGWGQYRVYVRRASDNDQYVHVETSQTFDLPALVWGEQYCVHVEPFLPSRPNPATRTEEQCISTPPLQDTTKARAILSVALLSLLALGVVATSWARAYVKKPMETPSVLESFRKQDKPWPLGMRGMELCLEVESVHQISLALKDQDHPHSPPAGASPSSGAAWLVPGKGTCWLPEALASDRADSPRLRDLADSSVCSSDSGICLQDPLGSRSLLLPAGPLECVGLLLGSDREDCGLGVGERLLQVATPASQADPEGLGSEEGLKQGDPPHAQFSGYQRQAGPPQEALSSSSCPPSSGGTAHSKPVLASGYLKQASVAAPSVPRPLALACHGQRHFLSSMAPGPPESLPCLPEFPKALLAPGFPEPPPHLSLLRSSVLLSLNLPWCRA